MGIESKINELGACTGIEMTVAHNNVVSQFEEAKTDAMRVRQNSTAYAVGDKVIVPGKSTYDFMLKCTTAGTSGSSAITYTGLEVDDTITDGTVVWTCVYRVDTEDPSFITNITNALTDESNTTFNTAIENIVVEKAGGRSIFEIFYSLSSSTPPGAMDLSLGTLITSCNTLYPDFWTACVAQKTAGTIRCLTESEWQAELTANGNSCGAFVVDDDTESESFGSVRLPKIVDYLRGGTDAQIGTYLGDAIRNITGRSAGFNFAQYMPGGTGAIRNVDDGLSTSASTDPVYRAAISFDASLVVPTADEDRPKTVYAKLYIQVYTTATSASMAQAAEFVTQLETKAGTSLEGLTTTGAGVIEEKAHNRVWTSTAQTLTANTSLVLTHNLGLPIEQTNCPTSVRWDMIARCTTAENGFAVGDVVIGLTAFKFYSNLHYWGTLSGVISQNGISILIPEDIRGWNTTQNLVRPLTFSKWQFFVRIFY